MSTVEAILGTTQRIRGSGEIRENKYAIKEVEGETKSSRLSTEGLTAFQLLLPTRDIHNPKGSPGRQRIEYREISIMFPAIQSDYHDKKPPNNTNASLTLKTDKNRLFNAHVHKPIISLIHPLEPNSPWCHLRTIPAHLRTI